MTVAGLSFAFNSLTNSHHFARKIGLFTDGRRDLAFDARRDWCAAHGIETIEIGAGNFSDAPHCNLARLLDSAEARADFSGALAQRGLRLSALNCSGNLLDPDPERRSASHKVFRADQGVRLALEMHPSQIVYNTRTLLRLREVCGAAVGANLDPSHLFWQRMDPLRVIGALGAAVFHVHAKDCWLDADEMALNGGLETRVSVSGTRAWEHCIPGKGHAESFWREFVAALQRVGYAGSLSIEYAGPRAEAPCCAGRAPAE